MEIAAPARAARTHLTPSSALGSSGAVPPLHQGLVPFRLASETLAEQCPFAWPGGLRTLFLGDNPQGLPPLATSRESLPRRPRGCRFGLGASFPQSARL